MPIVILVGVAFAVLYYRLAEYEGLSPLAWSVGSLALSAAIAAAGLGVGLMILAQFALFGALWWDRSRRAARRSRAP